MATPPKWPKGWTPFFVLVVCEGEFHPHELIVRYLIYGWGTDQYWLDYPTNSQIQEAIREHPDFDTEKIDWYLFGLCPFCQGQEILRNKLLL